LQVYKAQQKKVSYKGCSKNNLIIKLKSEIMGNLLYVIAVILIIAWAIGFIGYSAGGIIHVLLVIAVIAILFRVIQGRKII
jgi:hypothetical protein